MEKILDRFLRYVAIDTQSDEESSSQPSTAKQWDLLNLLADELRAMGVKAETEEHGYVYAKIPGNNGKDTPTIGFMAHVDTAPDASGKDVKPQIIDCYDGGDIPLKGVPGLFLKPSEFPELLHFKGETLITTDGTTLLGADDKAGVAEIMDAVQYIVTHPEFKHGPIAVAFTRDEEIGCGVDSFDVKRFGADFGYTMDGGEIGELEYENFNAASAKIHIQGRNVHPGSAKDKMKNAIHIATELNDLLPKLARPEYTEGYEGFFHLISFKGAVEEADIAYIIRDHDRAKFEARKEMMEKAAAFIDAKYGEGTVRLELKDQYYNMREMVEPHMHIVDTAVKAMELAGIKPRIQPIRGGTDGARLSFMGLPCPNLGTGGYNCHGIYEFVAVEDMEKMVQILLSLVKAQ